MVLGRPEWASTERGGGRLLLLLLGSALGEEDRVDVGEDTAVGDSNARKELGELLVVADGELDVAGDDARLLVVAGGVAGELEDLGTEVLEDGREVDGRGGGREGFGGGSGQKRRAPGKDRGRRRRARWGVGQEAGSGTSSGVGAQEFFFPWFSPSTSASWPSWRRTCRDPCRTCCERRVVTTATSVE